MKGYLRTRTIDLLWAIMLCLAVWLASSSYYYQVGFGASYKLCPGAQENEILLKSVQYQDGKTVCAYADLQGWNIKKWKDATK